jgi:dTDP-4-amino-4,6-dideoxygalactose transaminase
MSRLYLSPPHMCGREQEFINEAFATNWIAPLGPMVDGFEKDMCAYTGADHALALSSGTAALHLALIVSGVEPGDEVLCSSFTFAGSVFPIAYVGATPVFVDSELTSWNMDPGLLEAAIKDRIKKGKKPKAAVVVHLYGQSADMEAILDVCGRYEIMVIEDAAESLGCFYGKRHTGTIAPLGIFSFNGNKIITTSGGGMLVGHDEAMLQRAKFLSTQARENLPYYEHRSIGYNYRMSSIGAAIGKGQLTVIEERVRRRREIFDIYKKELGDLPGIGFMPEASWNRSNRWLTCITVDEKATGTNPESIRMALEKLDIESRPLWKPMHLQPVFTKCPAYTNGVSQGLFDKGLCLPSGTAMTATDIGRVVDRIRMLIKEKK